MILIKAPTIAEMTKLLLLSLNVARDIYRRRLVRRVEYVWIGIFVVLMILVTIFQVNDRPVQTVAASADDPNAFGCLCSTEPPWSTMITGSITFGDICSRMSSPLFCGLAADMVLGIIRDNNTQVATVPMASHHQLATNLETAVRTEVLNCWRAALVSVSLQGGGNLTRQSLLDMREHLQVLSDQFTAVLIPYLDYQQYIAVCDPHECSKIQPVPYRTIILAFFSIAGGYLGFFISIGNAVLRTASDTYLKSLAKRAIGGNKNPNPLNAREKHFLIHNGPSLVADLRADLEEVSEAGETKSSEDEENELILSQLKLDQIDMSVG